MHSFYTQQAFTQFSHTASLHTEKLLHRKVFTQRSFYTQQVFTQKSFCTQKFFAHSQLSHREALNTEKLLHTEVFYTEKPLTQRSIYTQQTFTQRRGFYRKAFAHRRFYTQQAFTQRSPYTEKHLQREVFTHRSFYTEAFTHSKLLHGEAFTQKCFYIQKAFTQSKRFKLRKSADESQSHPWCGHSNTIYDFQLQKTVVLRAQPWHQATLTQPLQCDLQRLSRKTQKNYAQDRRQNNAWTGSSTAGPIWEWSDPNRACSATARRKSFPVHLPGHVLVLSCKTKHFVHPLTFKIALRARLPSKSENGRCENELKIWKRSFRARRPSKSERGRCENEALVRDVPQNLKVRFLC